MGVRLTRGVDDPPQCHPVERAAYLQERTPHHGLTTGVRGVHLHGDAARLRNGLARAPEIQIWLEHALGERSVSAFCKAR